jgi:hypothetical protein
LRSAERLPTSALAERLLFKGYGVDIDDIEAERIRR